MSTTDKESSIVQDVSANRLMDLKETGSRLHVRRAFLFRLLNTGLLPYIKIGDRKKVSVFAVNNFIAKYETADLMEDLRQRELAMKTDVAASLGGVNL